MAFWQCISNPPCQVPPAGSPELAGGILPAIATKQYRPGRPLAHGERCRNFLGVQREIGSGR
jgi:hypothetical protein